MRSAKANIGSIISMADKVRQEKKKSAFTKAKAPLARAREPKKPFKSADTVDDSDSDSDSSSDGGKSSGSDSDSDLNAARAKFLASKAAKQNKTKPVAPRLNGTTSAATPTKSARKPDDESTSDSGSESDTSDSGGAPSTMKPIAGKQNSSAGKTQRKSSSGSSSSSSSGSSSESESDETGKKNNTGNDSKASARDENSESSSSSDDEEMPDADVQTNVNGSAQRAVVNGHESSSEESDSGSESDDEGDGGKSVARTNGKEIAKESTSQVSRNQWLNNSDFMLRKASSDNPGKEVADFFSSANLEGKQVWYFTAPASLPITVLKDMEIDLSKATNGGTLLTHNGDNYGLDLESYATNTQIQLLIPSSGGDKYTSLNHGIDSTVHLRRMAKFGPGEVHATATDNYVPVPKPVREQPEGLKVRYTPIGVPTPIFPSTAPTKSILANTSSSQTKKSAPVQSSSSSESGSESDADVEMITPTASIKPTGQTKSEKSSMTNGERKRKHAGDQDQTTKRLKAQRRVETPGVKQTPAHNSKSGPTSDATPSKKSSTKSKDKKEKAQKDKTPKSTTMTPNTAKQTPIPIPSYPGMKH